MIDRWSEQSTRYQRSLSGPQMPQFIRRKKRPRLSNTCSLHCIQSLHTLGSGCWEVSAVTPRRASGKFPSIRSWAPFPSRERFRNQLKCMMLAAHGMKVFPALKAALPAVGERKGTYPGRWVCPSMNPLFGHTQLPIPAAHQSPALQREELFKGSWNARKTRQALNQKPYHIQEVHTQKLLPFRCI